MSKDLEKFTSSSLRGQKKGIYEHSMCSLIMKGIQTDKQLTKIFTICEAALLSKNRDKLDIETVNICKDVCRSFMNTYPTKRGNAEYMRITWVFLPTEENWKTHIEPWHRCNLEYYTLFTDYRHTKYPENIRYKDISPFRQTEHLNELIDYNDRLKKKIVNDLAKLPTFFRFFVAASALSFYGYNILVGEFTNWALAELSDTRRKLTEEVSEDVWREFRGQEKEESKEEKTVDGDQMD